MNKSDKIRFFNSLASKWDKLKSRNIKLEIEIEHKFSYSSNELQVIDFVVWSINRKFNTGDDSYYKIIEEKIANKDSMILWK